MPIYEYECEKCKRVFEKLSKLDSPLPDCKGCEGDGSVKKLVSKCGFALKGTGWAFDGYSSPPE